MSEVTVQADALAQQASTYESVAQLVAEIQQNAMTDADSYATAWGGDDAGSLFGVRYLPLQNKALDQMGKAAEALQQMADTVQSWAQSYPATDANLR